MERRALSADQNVLMTHLVVWLLSLVSGILLGLRLFTKWLRAQQLWSDDGFLIASWVVIIFYSAITSLELALGAGRRQTSAPPAGPSALLLLDNVARSVALTAAAWSKTSLACTLLRLQSPRPVRAALYSVAVFVNMVLAGAAIAHWLRCRPIPAGWASGEGACWSISVQNIVGLSAQAFSAAMDLAVVVVVWQMLWTKGLSVGEKVGVGALMALGVLASATSAVTAVQIYNLTDENFQTANISVLLWASMEPNITIVIASIPTLRLLRASRGHSRHQKLFSRDKIRIVRTDDSRASPMAVGAPIFNQHAGAASTMTANSTAPPRPPRPTSNQSFWTDSSSILKGGDSSSNNNNNNNNNHHPGRGALAHEASTEDLIQQSPVYSPSRDHAPYPPGDNTLGVPDAGRDTFKPSTNGKRLTPLEEETSLRGSSVSGGMMMGNSNYASNFDSYYNSNNNNNNYRSSSKYSTGAFIDTYGPQAKNVVEGMEMIVPLSQQQQQYQRQQPQYPHYQQYQQYPQQQHQQQQSQNQNHARQQSSHRRKPSVTEAPMYMAPVTATGGYGGML
ncbi:putative integral membrane protein [Diaporthe ampelina]|uniref:Putative integral membrane protein n=1 Tax=Diaporthe ampelina TaxID=1214573 RepID=A0A0G2HUN1_9PEZI|nr:putative integral membrane protein [Diaporthe ampelina]